MKNKLHIIKILLRVFSVCAICFIALLYAKSNKPKIITSKTKHITHRSKTNLKTLPATKHIKKDQIKSTKAIKKNTKKTLQTLASNTSTKPSKFIFNVSKEPPEGFLALTTPQSVIVDIYYQGKFLGVTKANTTPNSLHFTKPEQVIEMIKKDLANTTIVQKALTGQIPNNTKYLCDEVRRSNCNILFPKVAAVLYDPRSFRAYIFVNHNFIKHSSKNFLEPLAPSSAGFSYINQLYAVSSNTTGKHSHHSHNLTSRNTWAYKNTRLNLTASYANNLTGDTSLQINRANFAINKNHHQYTLGMLDTLGNLFFSNKTVLGGEFKTTLDTIPKAANGIGSPINILLNFPSQVNVYKDGALIYTDRYQAGNQLIDTSNFPTGAYPIVIKITNGQGLSRKVRQFFVKTTQLAPPNMPQYYASFGYLMADRQFDSNILPEILPIPIYQVGTNIRLSPKWGMNFGLLGTDKNLFSKIGIVYLQKNWNLQSAFLAGLKGDVGYSGTLTYQNHKFSMYANAAQIWHRDKHKTYDISSSTDHYHRFLNSNTLHLNLNANYHFDKSSISLFANLNRSCNQPKTYSYGPKFTTELFRKNSSIVSFNLSATKSERDRSVLASIHISFSSQPISGYGSIGYNHIKNRTNSHLTEGGGLSANGAINWNHMDSTQKGYNFGINGNTNPVANNIGATYDYQNNRVQLRTFGNYNNTKHNRSFVQYGGSFNTHLIYTSSEITLSGSKPDSNTGVLVEAKSQQHNSTFDIQINNRLTKHIKAGEKTFVSLEPFNTYQVNIVNRSSSLYHFDEPKRTVTIYPGNVQNIIWRAVRKYIIAGRLLTPNKKPIPYAIIHGGVGYNATDDAGYFQLETNTDVNSFRATNHHDCKFSIPPPPVYNNFIYINEIICHPIRKKKYAETLY